jgi:hypothetical protein
MKKVIRTTAFPLLMILLGISSLTGCFRDDDKPENPPPPGNGGELITSLLLHFTDAADASVTYNYAFRDVDGEGGAAPIEWDTLFLDTSKVYHVRLTLLDESYPINILNISDEVAAEAADHFFCYETAGTAPAIMRTDSDGTYEVGLSSDWTTGATSGSGSVTITLRHQPGVKDGTCEPGDTDVQVTFVVQLN